MKQGRAEGSAPAAACAVLDLTSAQPRPQPQWLLKQEPGAHTAEHQSSSLARARSSLLNLIDAAAASVAEANMHTSGGLSPVAHEPSVTPSEAVPTEEDTEISDDELSREALRSAGRNSVLAKQRKQAGAMERMTSAKESQQPHGHQNLPPLAHGVEQLLSLDLPLAKKRGRGEGSDAVGDVEPRRVYRRPRGDTDFNASALIGSIFMRVQGSKAPAPLVFFEEDITQPQWFKESIDGVQPVMGTDDFDPEQVNLESMGKLVDGNVLPATLGEVAAYFTHVLGDPRTNKEITPRVLIAIQCDRAKGWFTYKRDNDNSNFVPVVLCAAENGRGLEEVSPAHFEVHRAQCAQKKWRQSFKVLGAQKLHKVTSLAQAALGDVLRHLERILGAERPMQLRSIDANGNATILSLQPRILTAANHPTFRATISQDQAGLLDDGTAHLLHHVGGSGALVDHMVQARPSITTTATLATTASAGAADLAGINAVRLAAANDEAARRLVSGQVLLRPESGVVAANGATLSTATVLSAQAAVGSVPAAGGTGGVGVMGPTGSQGVVTAAAGGPPGLPPQHHRITHTTITQGVSPARHGGVLPGARPMNAPLPGQAGAATGARLMLASKPVQRRHTDDPVSAALAAAAAANGGDAGRGLDLLATAASTAITSPRVPGGATGVHAGLLAAALSGISFNELLQLVLDNQQRQQQHQQQAQLLQHLAKITAQAAATEKLQLAAAVEATAAEANAQSSNSKHISEEAADPAGKAGAAAVAAGKAAAAAAGGASASSKVPVATKAALQAALAGPAWMPPPALSAFERDAIATVIRSVHGPDVAHAVRGILQHVAMQHVGEQVVAAPSATAALAAALTEAAAAAEGADGPVAAAVAVGAAAAQQQHQEQQQAGAVAQREQQHQQAVDNAQGLDEVVELDGGGMVLEEDSMAIQVDAADPGVDGGADADMQLEGAGGVAGGVEGVGAGGIIIDEDLEVLG